TARGAAAACGIGGAAAACGRPVSRAAGAGRDDRRGLPLVRRLGKGHVYRGTWSLSCNWPLGCRRAHPRRMGRARLAGDDPEPVPRAWRGARVQLGRRLAVVHYCRRRIAAIGGTRHSPRGPVGPGRPRHSRVLHARHPVSHSGAGRRVAGCGLAGRAGHVDGCDDRRAMYHVAFGESGRSAGVVDQRASHRGGHGSRAVLDLDGGVRARAARVQRAFLARRCRLVLRRRRLRGRERYGGCLVPAEPDLGRRWPAESAAGRRGCAPVGGRGRAEALDADGSQDARVLRSQVPRPLRRQSAGARRGLPSGHGLALARRSVHRGMGPRARQHRSRSARSAHAVCRALDRETRRGAGYGASPRGGGRRRPVRAGRVAVPGVVGRRAAADDVNRGMSDDRFDVIIVGTGQAGVPLAVAFAQAGRRTAIIERRHVGGTCVNEGCTPTKTMVASARTAYTARRAADFGVRTGFVGVDLAAVVARKRTVVESFRHVGDAARTVTSPLSVINTGGHPARPDIPGLDQVTSFDSMSIMELTALPEHLIVIGGGYVAVEFAQMFRRFGSAVTIVQRGPRLLGREDMDVADGVADVLRGVGIELKLGAMPTRVEPGRDAAVAVIAMTAEGETVVSGSHLLVATGREPNTATLGLEAAGVERHMRGYVKVNERLQTSAPGVYAAGDVTGAPEFTHVSYDDYRILRKNLIEHGSATTTGRIVPYTVFTDPQLGRIGMT